MPLLDLKNALKEWELWSNGIDQQPKIEYRLEGGLTNESHVLSLRDRKIKIRLNSKISNVLGIDRQQEEEIIRTLEPTGITPKLLYNDPSYRYSIFEFIEGRVWSSRDYADKAQQQRLHDHVNTFKKIVPNCAPRNYSEYLLHYWNQLKDKNIQLSMEERESILEFLEILEIRLPSWPKFALSHHDLIPENIIENAEGLHIIDWEYAAIGHPSLDKRTIENICHYQSGEANDLLDRLIFWLDKLWRQLTLVYPE